MTQRNGVVLYGGAPDPFGSPRLPETQPAAPIINALQLFQTQQPRRVRVCVLVAEDGAVKLKVLCDDKLIAEVEGTRSLTLETEIGGAQ